MNPRGFVNGFIYYSKSENFVMKNFAVDDVREIISMGCGYKNSSTGWYERTYWDNSEMADTSTWRKLNIG